MSRLSCDRVGGKRKVEDRNPPQQKVAVVNAGIPAYIHDHLARLKYPVRMGQFASRNRPVVDHVMLRAGLLDALSGKRKGSGRCQDQAISLQPQPRRSPDVVEPARLGGQVVGSMAGFDMVIVRASVQRYVTRCGGFTTVGVIGDFIGPEDVGPVVDLGVAAKFVDVSLFFLLDGTNQRSIVELSHGAIRARVGRLHGGSLLPIGLPGSRSSLIGFGVQLGGY